MIIAIWLVLSLTKLALSSSHYTAKQLDALAERVGGEFWIHAPAGKAPLFLTAPAPGAATFRPSDNESFEITELIGRADKKPYYKVKYQSGKIAYLRPETFHEEFNSTIVNSDPRADEKRQAEQLAEDEKQRVAWINAQGWPAALKEAAIKKQPSPGLTSGEVRQVMGPPRRIAKTAGLSKTRAPLRVNEERWFYPDGSVLLFSNGILSKVDRPGGK
ncbi:MAG: hypothetical protein ACREOR_09850 [Candidatus Binatia bacterium]